MIKAYSPIPIWKSLVSLCPHSFVERWLFLCLQRKMNEPQSHLWFGMLWPLINRARCLLGSLGVCALHDTWQRCQVHRAAGGPMGGGAGETGGHSTSYKPCYFGGDLPGQSRAVHTYSSAREVCAMVHSKAGEMRRVPPGAE